MTEESKANRGRIANRRSVIKGAGVAIASMAAVHPASATNSVKDIEGESSPEPEYIDWYATHWSPTTVSPYENATLQSQWKIRGTDYYQLDVLVEADIAQKPSISSHNLHSITERFEYRSDSPIGPAYHFQAKGIFDGADQDRYLDSIVTPTDTGALTASTGTFWPFQDWTSGTLYVE